MIQNQDEVDKDKDKEDIYETRDDPIEKQI